MRRPRLWRRSSADAVPAETRWRRSATTRLGSSSSHSLARTPYKAKAASTAAVFLLAFGPIAAIRSRPSPGARRSRRCCRLRCAGKPARLSRSTKAIRAFWRNTDQPGCAASAVPQPCTWSGRTRTDSWPVASSLGVRSRLKRQRCTRSSSRFNRATSRRNASFSASKASTLLVTRCSERSRVDQ